MKCQIPTAVLFSVFVAVAIGGLVLAQGTTAGGGVGVVNPPNLLHCHNDSQPTCVAYGIINRFLFIATPIAVILILISASHYDKLPPRSNGDRVFRAPSGALYVLETNRPANPPPGWAPHWDVQVIPRE